MTLCENEIPALISRVWESQGLSGLGTFYILITRNGGNPHVNIQSIMLSFNSTTKLDLTQTTSWNGFIEDID